MKSSVRFFTIGNALTVSRLVLLPAIIAGIALHIGYLAVVAMGLALLTDLLDGKVSRYLKQASEFGARLDSTTDFVFLHLLFVAFYAVHVIHTYQFLVIYAAMLVTMSVESMANIASGRAKMPKTRFSKPTGAFEYLYLLFLVVRLVIPNTKPVMLVDSAIFAAIAICVVLHLWESACCLKTLCKPATE